MARFAAVLCVALVAVVATAHAANPHRWINTEADPSADYLHKVVIALKQSNLDVLREVAESVSNPDSISYGQYLSIDEVTDIVAPPKHAFKAVVSWLESAGAANVAAVQNRDVVVAHFPLAALETAMGVRMTVWKHPEGHYAVRTAHDIRLPRSVADYVDIIHNVNDFPLPRRRRARDMVQDGNKAAVPLTGLPASAVPGAVNMTGVVSIGGYGYIAATMTVTCLDGSSTNANPPCSDHPPAVNNFKVTASSPRYNDTRTAFDLGECVSVNGVMTCTVNVDVDFYKLYNVTAQAIFSTSSGPVDAWPLPSVSTPAVTPQTIASLYNIPPNILQTNGSQMVGEFERQYYSPSDLDMFFREMGIVGADTPVTVIGMNNASDPGLEANLDIQYIMGVARGVPTTLWSIYAKTTVEIDHILTLEYALGNATSPPLVNSLSYGMTSGQVNEYLGAGYLERSDVEFQKLVARGIAIIIADGDTGAGDLGPPPMSEVSCKTLHPDWPSQSPYVTAISSTYITPAAQPICYLPLEDGGVDCLNQPAKEVTVNMDYGLFWTSGGGFSNTTPRPSYQAAFVDKYLKKTDELPPSYMFNSTGRAYPDATAVGHNLMVVAKGKFTAVDGTSASAPIFAGVMSLINSELLNHGLPQLGFLNPFLYKAATDDMSSFNDITVGNNRCGGQGFAPLCCSSGYGAGVGWDAASGLGSPNYPVLLKQALMYGQAAKARREALKQAA